MQISCIANYFIMENKAGRLISIIHRKVYQKMALKLKGCDVDVGQFFFLRHLIVNPGITQEEVARKLYLDKATVSKGIKRLEKRGYIQKNINPKDKRAYFLFPTEKTLNIKTELEQYYNEIRDYLFNGLAKKEYQQLENILQKIVNHIEH